MKPIRVHIDLACNDPDNGNFVGRFQALQVRAGDIDLEFEGPWDQAQGIKFSEKSGFARIGRIKVPIIGSQSWFGNWCWDSIVVSERDALKIIAYIGRQTKQGWYCSGGDALLCDIFDLRRQITLQEWNAYRESDGAEVSTQVSKDAVQPTDQFEEQNGKVLLGGVPVEGSQRDAEER